MLKSLSLQNRLVSAFLVMSGVVLGTALVGWSGNSRLSKHIDTIANNSMPSVVGLWEINEGQTQVQSSMRALANEQFSDRDKEIELDRLRKAWQQIDAGFKKYENLSRTPEEEILYTTKFTKDWSEWKTDYEEFVQLYQTVRRDGLSQADLLQLNRFLSQTERASFDVVTEELNELIAINNDVGQEAEKLASLDVKQTSLWIFVAMVGGPLAAIIFGVYFSRAIAKPLGAKINQVVDVAEQISVGNLTTQVERDVASRDEIGKLQNAFFAMIQNLNSLIRQVQQSGIQVTTSSTKLAASGRQLEATMTEQTASTNEVVVTAKQIAATASDLVMTMETVASMSQSTTNAASHNQTELLRMAATMRQLVAATDSISNKLEVISEKANNISGVVNTITKVADQTNLLSLNAAIEAEKAGEYGLGFAVVAREIRRLADQTAVATLDIEQMVKEMQSSVTTGVMEMDKFTKEVARGVEDVNQISGQLGQIIDQVQALTPRFETVNQGMEAQAQGAQQISIAMVQLSETSTQTADSLREINNVIEQLNQASHGLRQEISRFKVSTEVPSSKSLVEPTSPSLHWESSY